MNLLDLGNGVNRFKFPIKIHLMCNWDTSENLSKLWRKMRPDNSNIKLVEFEEADYYIIINGLNGIDKIPPLNKTICMAMEPDWEVDSVRWKKNPRDGKNWFNSRDDFLYLLDHKYKNNSEWHLSKTIQELKIREIEKKKEICFRIDSVISSLNIMEQHKLRIEFYKQLEQKLKADFEYRFFNTNEFDNKIVEYCLNLDKKEIEKNRIENYIKTSKNFGFDKFWNKRGESKEIRYRRFRDFIIKENYIGEGEPVLDEKDEMVIQYLFYIYSSGLSDTYGRDNKNNYETYISSLPSHKKDDGIFPYKYTFIAENCDKENYFTEKLIDAILGECLCFYSGPSNIEDFIDSRAFYKVDLSEEKRESEIKKVINAMNNGEWEKRIEFIKKEKQKILNYYNFFTRVEYLIDISKMKKIVFYSTEDRKNNFISKYKEKINSVGDLQFEEYKTDLKQVKERNNILFPNSIRGYQKIENDILVLNECSNFTKHFLDKLGIVYTKAKEIGDWDVLILDRGNQMTNNTYCEILKLPPFPVQTVTEGILKSEVSNGSENYILNSRIFYKKNLSDLIIYRTQEKLVDIETLIYQN